MGIAPALPSGAVLRNDAELALQTVTMAEIAFRLWKNSPRPEGAHLGQGSASLRHRFAARLFAFTEAATLAARRQRRAMTAPDGMIAAVAH
jgi:predicted nucleic acid-binding protein